MIEVIGKILSTLPSFSYSDGLLWKGVVLTAFMDEQMKPFPHQSHKPIEGRMGGLGEGNGRRMEINDSFKNWVFQRVEIKEKEANLLNEIATWVLEDIEKNA